MKKRVQIIKELVFTSINKIKNHKLREKEMTHIYGVSSMASLLALKRGLEPEIAVIIGYLHDIGRVKYKVNNKSHARIGSEKSLEILNKTGLFKKSEIKIITNAIARHMDKAQIHDDYAELIKDADVLEKYLQNLNTEDYSKVRKKRINAVKKELKINLN